MTQPQPHRALSRFIAIIQQRCPRCLKGAVFSDLLQTFEQCPQCELKYEREPGYFTGAMYLSFGMAGLISIPLWLLLVYYEFSSGWIMPFVGAVLVGVSPLVFRYSRVVWLHLDQLIAPR